MTEEDAAAPPARRRRRHRGGGWGIGEVRLFDDVVVEGLGGVEGPDPRGRKPIAKLYVGIYSYIQFCFQRRV